jgi:FAD/FMN-containing dehydrogenase
VSETVAATSLETLGATFSGLVLTPGDGGYEETRLVHNGLVDKRPGVIARCQNTADIVDAVRYGGEIGADVAVRGGGHSVAGLSVCDGGTLIDLSAMKGIHVNPGSRRVRAQGGVTWSEYNRTTHAYGLATTGGVVSTTGIAGLTLGGGIGWLMPKYGMATDNLVSAEVVTADGQIRTASAAEEPELFWGIRGGGGNFGVVSSFEYEAHPVSTVYGGLVAFDLSDAHKVMGAFRDESQGLPDELMTMCALVHAPDGSGTKISAIGACHCGDPGKAEQDVKPLRAAAPVLLDMLGPLPYPVMNTLLDAGYPKGARNYWKSAFFRELSDDAIAIMIDAFRQTPSAMSGLAIENFHGEVTRVDPTATAYPHRRPGYNLILTSVWTDAAEDEANIIWAKETFAALRPFMEEAVYVNYLDADEAARGRAAYGPNWERLVEVKRQYDPDNFFHINLNIKP